MGKTCHLVWHEGYLTCTAQHRDYSECDLVTLIRGKQE